MKRTQASLHVLVLTVLSFASHQAASSQAVVEQDSLKADSTSLVSLVQDSLLAKPMLHRSYDSSEIGKFPERNIDHMVALVPGVIMLDNTLFFRGGRSDETGSYLDGFPTTDVVNGGRGITLSQDALYSIDILTGNYSVGAGRGNSGLVNYSTKTGGPDISASLEYVTDNVTAAGKGKAFNGSKRLGAYWYGYSEIIATLGGPVIDSRIRFFGSVNYSYQRDRNPQRYPGIYLGLVEDPLSRDTVDLRYPAGPLLKNSLEQTTWAGNLLCDLDGLLVKFTGTTTHREFYNPFNNGRTSGNIASMFDADRIERVRDNNTLLGIRASYLLNPQMSIEVSGSYTHQSGKACDPYLEDNFLRYGDSVANAAAGFTWPGRYQTPSRKLLYEFSFSSPGDLVANYEKYKNESLTLRSRFSLEMFNRHKLEVGGEVQSFTIRRYSISNPSLLVLAREIDRNSILPEGDPYKRTPAQILTSRSVNNFGYDVLGNETDATGIDAPRSPVFASAYVQDGFTARDLTMNVGLRYDYFNADNLTLLNPAHPELTVDQRTGTIMESGLRKTGSSNTLSPRIGALLLIDSRSALHSQFGKYVQQPRLQEMYWGVNAAVHNILIDGIPNYKFAFDLKPTRTTLYEFGYSSRFDDLARIDLTGYYKQMNDLVIFDYQATGGRYGSLRNGGRSIAKGVELTFSMQRRKRVRVDACLALQDVRGPGSFPTSNLGSGPLATGDTTIFILQQLTGYSRVEASNLIRGNILFDYRFGADDGGTILEQLGTSILLTFNSGHPYTRYRVNSGVEWDLRQRIPIEGISSSTTPWFFQVDLHVDKTLNIIDKLNANVYISVINLFDARNIQNVFLTTGQPDDDGWLSDPQYGGQWIKSFGQTYADVYKAINIDYLEQYQNGVWPGGTPSIYGPPRQIRFGVKLEY